jgi:hypothetical protein
LLAILAVLFSTLLLAACGDEPKLPDAIIDIRAGTVQVKALPDAAYLPAADGQELVQGNEVRAGSSSKIAIIFFDVSVTLLEDGAELRIDRLQGSATSGFSSVALFQAGSRTIHRVQKLVDADADADAAYVLRTSSSVALVRGTGFIVEDDPVTGTELKSFEGRVGLAGESGVEVAVVAGESSTTPVGGDPAPPIPDPLTPEEFDSVDEVETVIDENEVEPPAAKDPDISTPIPGPTATLPPLPPTSV